MDCQGLFLRSKIIQYFHIKRFKTCCKTILQAINSLGTSPEC